MSREDRQAQSKTAAARAVRSELALEAVAASGKIEVDDGDVDAEIARLAKEYNLTEEQAREGVSLEQLRQELARRKALELVKGAVKKPAKKSAGKDQEEEQADQPASKPAKKAPAKKAAAQDGAAPEKKPAKAGTAKASTAKAADKEEAKPAKKTPTAKRATKKDGEQTAEE